MMFALMLALSTWAAPHPATTSSVLTDPAKGFSFQSYGFKLDLEKSKWQPIQKESESIFAEIEFEKKGEKDSSPAQLSLRMDELEKTQGVETYAKKWMRDYPQYGFEILSTKSFSHASGQGVVVDLYHRPNNKQLRQVILLKGKKVAILTCSNERQKFALTLAECNELVKNFAWLGSSK
jgi:hypothetical protein